MAVQANIRHKAILNLGGGVKIYFPPPPRCYKNYSGMRYFVLEFRDTTNGEKVPMCFEAVNNQDKIWSYLCKKMYAWGTLPPFEHRLYTDFNLSSHVEEQIDLHMQDYKLTLVRTTVKHGFSEIVDALDKKQVTIVEIPNTKPFSCFRELDRIMP